ncbi:MAG: cytochrome b/b6 domain-containing protein [Sphingomonadaceae bacterium]|nr:cytochrome b/b6 domain-containing protein [Sphingomonadaceae bacterium]
MAGARLTLWDLPTRIVHWSLVVLIPFSWWSAENHDLERHRWSGYAILGLLIFRLIWGFVGSSTSRFATFLRGPRAVIAYARGRGEPGIGHNPMGGWSVMVMLALLATQVGLGLFASDDDGLETGPLNHLVSYAAAETITELHELMFNVLVAMIALHVATVLFYLFVRRDNLIAPMLRGSKQLDAEPAVRPVMARPVVAVVVAIIAFAIMAWISKGAPLS